MDNKNTKSNRIIFLGFLAAFLTFSALSLFYASDTWAKEYPAQTINLR